ncbi:MAG: hypothetical protein H6867_08410 [Rhodospirillales bacterium]|nr:hypothetical protein [Rhodospirillales bacterium]MCB9995575.1 hypothetical protein [Rhodospirillales bacterium]
MAGPTTDGFNTGADGGNNLTVEELTRNHPMSEWNSVIEGAQPQDLEQFGRNLKIAITQDFDDKYSAGGHIGFFNVKNELARYQDLNTAEGALRTGADFSQNPTIQQFLDDKFKTAREDAILNKDEPPTYTETQLKQDLDGLKQQMLEQADNVIEQLKPAEPDAPAADAEGPGLQQQIYQQPVAAPGTFSA